MKFIKDLKTDLKPKSNLYRIFLSFAQLLLEFQIDTWPYASGQGFKGRSIEINGLFEPGNTATSVSKP